MASDFTSYAERPYIPPTELLKNPQFLSLPPLKQQQIMSDSLNYHDTRSSYEQPVSYDPPDITEMYKELGARIIADMRAGKNEVPPLLWEGIKKQASKSGEVYNKTVREMKYKVPDELPKDMDPVVRTLAGLVPPHTRQWLADQLPKAAGIYEASGPWVEDIPYLSEVPPALQNSYAWRAFKQNYVALPLSMVAARFLPKYIWSAAKAPFRPLTYVAGKAAKPALNAVGKAVPRVGEWMRNKQLTAIPYDPKTHTGLWEAGRQLNEATDQARLGINMALGEQEGRIVSDLVKPVSTSKQHFDRLLKAAQTNEPTQPIVDDIVTDLTESAYLAREQSPPFANQTGHAEALKKSFDDTMIASGHEPGKPLTGFNEPSKFAQWFGSTWLPIKSFQDALWSTRHLLDQSTDFFPNLRVLTVRKNAAIDNLQDFYLKNVGPLIKRFEAVSELEGNISIREMGTHVAALIEHGYRKGGRRYGAHINDDTYKKVIQQWAVNPHLRTIAKDYLKVTVQKNAEMLDLMHDSGMISTPMYDNFVQSAKKMGGYINLQREFEHVLPDVDDAIKRNFVGPVRSATYGPHTDVDWGAGGLVGQQLRYQQAVINAAHNTTINRSFARAIDGHVGAEIAKVIRETGPFDTTIAKPGIDYDIETGRRILNDVQDNEIPFLDLVDDQLVKSRIQFDPKYQFIVDALTGKKLATTNSCFDRTQSPILSIPALFFDGMSSWLRKSAVDWNVFFWARNVIKDLSAGYTTVKMTMGKQGADIFLSHYYNPFQNSGLHPITRFAEIMDNTPGFASVFKDMAGFETVSEASEYLLKISRTGFSTLDDVRRFFTVGRTFSEMMGRWAQYDTGIQMGVNPLLAAERSLSQAFFNEHAGLARALNAVYPFANASIRCWSDMWGVMKAKPSVAVDVIAELAIMSFMWHEIIRYFEPVDKDTNIHRLDSLTDYEAVNTFKLLSIFGIDQVPVQGLFGAINGIGGLLSQSAHGTINQVDAFMRGLHIMEQLVLPLDFTAGRTSGIFSIIGDMASKFKPEENVRGTTRSVTDSYDPRRTPEHYVDAAKIFNKLTNLELQPSFFNPVTSPLNFAIAGTARGVIDITQQESVMEPYRKTFAQIAGFSGSQKATVTSRMFYQVSQRLNQANILRKYREYKDSKDYSNMGRILSNPQYRKLNSLYDKAMDVSRELGEWNTKVRSPYFSATLKELADKRITRKMQAYLKEAFPVYVKGDLGLKPDDRYREKVLQSFLGLVEGVWEEVESTFSQTVGEGGLQSPALQDGEN